MPDTYVKLPDGSWAQFPEGTSDADITAALSQDTPAPKDGTPSWLRAMETGTRGVTDAPANAVSGDEPTTFAGGFLRSLKDQTLKATAGNPALQGAARPQTTGDMLGLVLPDANIAGKAIATGIQQGPAFIEKTGRFLRTVGRSAKAVGLPSGIATMATGHRGVGAAITAAPYLAEGTGAALERTGQALGRSVFEGPQAASQVDRWMPNVSTAERTIGPARQSGRVPYASPTEAVAQPIEGLDRYMANTSDAVGVAQAPSDLARVPYAAETPRPAPGEVGRLTSNRTPTLSETLTDAVQAARGQEPPMAVSHTPPVGLTPTGRPGVTGQEYDLIMQQTESLPSKARGELRPDVANVSKPTPPSRPAGGQTSAPMSDDAVRAEMAKMGIPQEAIDRAVLGGTRPRVPAAIQPVASHAPVEPPINPDLQRLRVDTGAERTARATGQTTEQVRMTTKDPILHATGVDPSLVLPNEPFDDIAGKMLAMPKDGPDRLAFVEAARDPKTKAQVYNMWRAYKKAGVAVAGAAMLPDAVRQELMRMMGQRSDR